MKRLLAWMVCSLLLAQAPAVAQSAVALDVSLGERIESVKNNAFFPVSLETTVFQPEGAGPFPVAVINHGKDAGNNAFQARARFLPAAREFLQRGYTVVVPMRQGFSKSGGRVVGEGCNIAGNGEAQAEDLKAVTTWLKQQPWADTSRMVMLGQSHGGLTTLAYAQDPDPGYKLFVNFAGGLRWINGSCQWELALVEAFARFGGRTKVPSLWFYGENDSIFPPTVVLPAHQAYVQAGGAAELIAYGPFGSDAHSMFSAYGGLGVWWDKVEAKLAAAGLPTAIILPQYSRANANWLKAPEATGFAALDSVEKVPHLKDAGRAGYSAFLSRPEPRAFAIAPNGAWGWASDGEDPLQRALDACGRNGAGKCRFYAVNQDVVWKEE